MSASFDEFLLEYARPFPEPVEPPPLVAHMKPDRQDAYIAEFAEKHPDSYSCVVFDALTPGAIYAGALCRALATGDHTEAGRLMAEMVREDLVHAIDRRRNALP